LSAVVAFCVTPITDFAVYLPNVVEAAFAALEEETMSTTNSSVPGPRAPSHYIDEWVQNTRARHELMMLSDRELCDIGLERTYSIGGRQVSLQLVSLRQH
jgi:uncharacterized protein YjiS (DUF1127 family)